MYTTIVYYFRNFIPMKIEEAIRQKKFEHPQQKAVLNLIYTYNWISSIYEKFFKSYDLTSQQYNVLRILRGKYPDHICAGEVKDVMLDKNPDLTRLCDRLLKKNLIKRETNVHNRRQVLLCITEDGLALLAKMDPEVGSSLKAKNLDDKEALLLSNLLDKMRG